MANHPKKFFRRRKLIEPRIQLRLIGTFLLVGAVATLMQGLNLIHALNTSSLSSSSSALAEQAPQLVFGNLLFGFAICVPMVVVVGVYVTFRLVGPLYRFRVYLKDVAANGYSGPCRIRKDDELQELCSALNAAVDRLRGSHTPASVGSASATVVESPAAPLPASEAKSEAAPAKVA